MCSEFNPRIVVVPGFRMIPHLIIIFNASLELCFLVRLSALFDIHPTAWSKPSRMREILKRKSHLYYRLGLCTILWHTGAPIFTSTVAIFSTEMNTTWQMQGMTSPQVSFRAIRDQLSLHKSTGSVASMVLHESRLSTRSVG